MQNFAYDPFLVTFGLCAVFCFGLILRVAFAISKPVISTMIPTYALSALFFAYPLLYWFKGAQGGGFGWLAGVLIALAMVCLSVVAFIASLLLHPWEQSSFFDRRVQEDPKAQLEQWYPNCRAKRLHSGKWLLTRSEEHTSELQSLMRISYAGFC